MTAHIRWAPALVSLMAFALTACGSPAQPSTPPADATSTASWEMPNLVGLNLQEAQNIIQKLTSNAIFVTRSHDATGASRSQVLDRNWKVCSQNVAAGSSINSSTKIDFAAVKVEERCP